MERIKLGNLLLIIQEKKQQAIQANQFEMAASLRDEEKRLMELIKKIVADDEAALANPGR